MYNINKDINFYVNVGKSNKNNKEYYYIGANVAGVDVILTFISFKTYTEIINKINNK